MIETDTCGRQNTHLTLHYCIAKLVE